MSKAIFIIGAGWLGLPLAEHLLTQGHQISATSTDAQKCIAMQATGINALCWHSQQQSVDVLQPAIAAAEVVIITLPFKRNIDVERYVATLAAIATLAQQSGCQQLYFTSSTSVYAQGNWPLGKHAPLADGHGLVLAEQMIAAQFEAATILRLSGLIGTVNCKERHPSYFIAGKEKSDGHSPINLIDLADIISCFRLLLERPKPGAFNLSYPDHRNKAEYYADACKARGLAPVRYSFESSQPLRKVIGDFDLLMSAAI